jgi:hypothetical protein
LGTSHQKATLPHPKKQPAETHHLTTMGRNLASPPEIVPLWDYQVASAMLITIPPFRMQMRLFFGELSIDFPVGDDLVFSQKRLGRIKLP